MRTISILFVSLFWVNNLIAQQWTMADSIPIAVRAGNTATYAKGNDGWLIVVSGRAQSDKIIKTVQRYQLSTNSWDTMMPHPTGLLGGATVVVKDSLYVIGGVINPPNIGEFSVYRLDLVNNNWKAVANLPIPLVDAKAVAYQDSIIYVAGGSGGAITGIVYMYNINNNKWRKASSFPVNYTRSFGGFARVRDTLIYMCGTDGFGSKNLFKKVHLGVIDKTDRSKIVWSLGADFPGKTRVFFDAHEWGAKGIIMTGGSTDQTFLKPSDECYTYSPGENVWRIQTSKPTAWTTGQSGTLMLADSTWKLICAGGYNAGYLHNTEVYSEKLFPVGVESNRMIDFYDRIIFPNPLNDKLIFKASEQDIVEKIILKDLLGKIIMEWDYTHIKYNNGYSTVDTHNLHEGLYLIIIKSSRGSTTNKIVVKR